MIRRSQFSRLNDFNGTFADCENEMIDRLRYDNHLSGECRGIPECAWCLAEEAGDER